MFTQYRNFKNNWIPKVSDRAATLPNSLIGCLQRPIGSFQYLIGQRSCPIPLRGVGGCNPPIDQDSCLIGKRSFTTKQHSHEVIETSSMNWQQSPQSTNKVSDSKLKNSPSGDRGVTPPNFDLEGIQFASSNPMSNKKGIEVSLRERFIQRLILDGKKATASKIFDESLELLKKRIEQYNSSNDGRGKSDDLHSLSTLTKDEIFVIALRKAQPWVTTSSLRRGGKKVIIPEILTPSQQESMAIR